MPFKLRMILLAGLFLGFSCLLIFLIKSRQPVPAAAKISVQEKADSSDPGPSLLLPLKEQFANEKILEAALLKLPEDWSREGSFALAKRIKIVVDKVPGQVQIVVLHPDRKRAASEANAVAGSIQSYYFSLSTKYKDLQIESLNHQLEERRKSLETLEEKIKTLQTAGDPREEDHALERELSAKERHLAVLKDTYKDQHPEVIQTQKEIDYLMNQIASRPEMPANKLQLAQGQYDTVMTRYQELMEKRSQAELEKRMNAGPIQIIARASSQTLVSRPARIPIVFFSLLGVMLLAALSVFLYTKQRKSREL